MHTIKQENSDNWYVGRIETDLVHGSQFVPMFHGLGIVTAIQLVNMLNGGNYNLNDFSAKTLPCLWVK